MSNQPTNQSINQSIYFVLIRILQKTQVIANSDSLIKRNDLNNMSSQDTACDSVISLKLPVKQHGLY